MSSLTHEGQGTRGGRNEALERIALSLLTARCLMLASFCVFFGPPLLLASVLYGQTQHHTPDAGWGLMGFLSLWPVALFLEVGSLVTFVVAAAWASTLKQRRKMIQVHQSISNR